MDVPTESQTVDQIVAAAAAWVRWRRLVDSMVFGDRDHLQAERRLDDAEDTLMACVDRLGKEGL